ncbi:MAG TPA: BadF/BadG/BcrA/BcrD ATPase family protein [Gemmatimonadaceae bacterium]|nr:BadF/BadG/BcrA/BcrD ATPase family protein [Gemmatimonadaceae bacterium]
MTAIVIGVDGGGTKTTALVADDQGHPIVEATGAPSAVRAGAVDESADAIVAVVREALAKAELDVLPRVVCVGVAGVGRESLRLELWEALTSREIAEEVVVHTDYAVAFDDAFGQGPGILLLAGTGSVAVGRGPTGAMARCGGWGPDFGDEGGGAWIGRRALSIVAAAGDGREPETALSGAVLTATESTELADLIGWAADATPATIATLAPVVFQVADTGDLRANALLDLATEELAVHARALARQLFTDERASVPIALAGGLLGARMPLRRRLTHRLKSVVPGAEVRHDDVVAARGAVRSALHFLGNAV